MKTKKKTEKQNEICGRFTNQQEMWQWVIFLKKNNYMNLSDP